MNRDEVFSEFVAARSKALLRTAYLISGDEAMAQDLLQEGLTKTYVALPKLRDSGAVEGYARKVIATTAISWWRRKSSREYPHETIPDREHPDASDAIDERQWIWEELLRLPPRQRVAIVLRYDEDLTQEQTAESWAARSGRSRVKSLKGSASSGAVSGQTSNWYPRGEHHDRTVEGSTRRPRRPGRSRRGARADRDRSGAVPTAPATFERGGAAAIAVALVALAVPGLQQIHQADDQGSNAAQPGKVAGQGDFAERKVTYAAGSEIHYGEQTISVAPVKMHAFVQVTNGFGIATLTMRSFSPMETPSPRSAWPGRPTEP